MRSKGAYPFLLLLLSCSLAQAQVDTIKQKHIELKEKKSFPRQPIIIKTSPTAILLGGGVFPISAEYRLMVEMTGNRKQSEQLGISLLGKSILWKVLENAPGSGQITYKIRGVRIQYAHKFYLVSRRGYAPHGFYFAPMFSYASVHASPSKAAFTRNIYYDFKNISMNMMIGVQTGKTKKMSMDIYMGPGYKTTTVRLHYSNGTSKPYPGEEFGPLLNTHLNFVFGINIGFCLY
jgi:hypothetical protein